MTTISRLFAVVACCALTGCTAFPSAFDILSWSSTGISYALSGKSPSDHLLSMAMKKDCTVSNVVFGKNLCADPDHIPAAQGAHGLASPTVLAVGNGQTTDRRVGFGLPKFLAPFGGKDSTTGSRRAYIVIGSFERIINATMYSNVYADYRAVVAPTYVSGKEHFRVVIGPLGDQETQRLTENLVPSGLPSHWLAWLCSGTLAPPPCKGNLTQVSIL